ncbi:MetQ/NlpA family ABC transporter substrate-binding protein [uncultured Pseudomonas sp.]|uniref:MetQ/NlpA family ABC transporter substrate-binding protein n=1 Tax=uncultured Pseudomonas sp. TaxID=114707 RepID=UPI00259304EA|nr:MetQ/NlpA family ABC transporter substrate-binding protein [uncultured Pseudomonas sp.]
MLEKLIRPVAAVVIALGFSSAALANQPLKIGTTSAFAIPLEAAVEEAHKQGLEVKLIEFSDWIAPNVSLNSGDIDVNYFQHIPFLENAKAAAGFDLVPYAPGIINNVGLYSKRYKSFADLPEGASVAIANDPINSGRGLQLLAKAGLITLKPGVGYKATEQDITANPKKLKIIQVEAVQLVRAYDDADLVQEYPAYIRLANSFDATSALLFDGLENKEYVIQFVIRPQSRNDLCLAKFVDIYQHSPAVRAALDKAHGTLYQAGWE